MFPDTEEILDTIKKLNIKVAIICGFKGKRRPLITSYRYTINISSHQENFTSSMQLRDMGGILGFSATHNLTKNTNLFYKRLIDICLSIVAAVIVIPFSIIIALIIKITSPGPVFYGHKRIGKNGKTIKCWKFRSMYKNSQEMLEKILAEDPVRREEWERDRKFVDDPRVTPFGKILRKTSLDELPQLWNILLGDMTFVGTRPEVVKYVDQYRPEYYATLLVPAGVTSEASIRYKDEYKLLSEAKDIDKVYVEQILPAKMLWNLESIERFRFLRDILTMVRTIFAVMGKEYR